MYRVFCEIEIKYITDVKPLACNAVCINICYLYRLYFLLKEPFFTAKLLRLTIKVSHFDIVNGPLLCGKRLSNIF